MKRTILSAFALSVICGVNLSYAQSESRVGVTIYKYDDHFMT